MRGYGLYVWGSYAMTLAAMLFEAAAVVRGRRAHVRAVREVDVDAARAAPGEAT